jgi:hypothetical protein
MTQQQPESSSPLQMFIVFISPLIILIAVSMSPLSDVRYLTFQKAIYPLTVIIIVELNRSIEGSLIVNSANADDVLQGDDEPQNVREDGDHTGEYSS